jgi:hypothetical protein
LFWEYFINFTHLSNLNPNPNHPNPNFDEKVTSNDVFIFLFVFVSVSESESDVAESPTSCDFWPLKAALLLLLLEELAG